MLNEQEKFSDGKSLKGKMMSVLNNSMTKKRFEKIFVKR